MDHLQTKLLGVKTDRDKMFHLLEQRKLQEKLEEGEELQKAEQLSLSAMCSLKGNVTTFKFPQVIGSYRNS